MNNVDISNLNVDNIEFVYISGKKNKHTEINELNDIINDLIKKHKLNSKFSFFFANFNGKSMFQIKKTVIKFKTQLQNKEREKKMLQVDIETTENLIIICNKKLKDLYN